MATAEAAVRLFDSFAGTVEAPPHSNRTFIGAEFGWNGVPWCCESCWVVCHRLGVNFPHTASVAQAVADAKAGRFQLTWVPRGGVIRGGDMATYDWGGRGNPSSFHIAMVRDPFDGTTRFQTVGGNENDAVRIQWRDRAFVQGFIRPAYTGTVIVVPPVPAPITDENDDGSLTAAVLNTHN